MRQLQKVLWTKGILLSPQHLQAQDRYLEGLIGNRLGATGLVPWGFSRLEIDHEALEGGTFRLAAAQGLFPDGLPLDSPGSDPQPPPRPLDGHWSPDQRTLALHLGVPEHRDGGQNVALADDDRIARMRSEVVMRRDENTGLSEKPLQIGKRNLRLLVEGEVLEGHTVMPVARLLRSESGQIQLDPQFIPPLLDISASDRLMATVLRLVEVLSARSTDLSGTRRQRNRSLADFGASDIANFWLLYTVNSHLPIVRHLHEVRRGHPESLYRTLLSLAGALTSFSTTHHPRDLPIYDHSAPGECFGRLETIIHDLLATVVPANHITLPLRETTPLVYATAMDEDRLFSATQVLLGIRSTLPRNELVRRVPQLLKISAADQIDRLIRQALPGVELRHADRPPSEMPVKLDYEYFTLERTGADWTSVRTARNLAAYVPSDLPEPQLELIVLLPREGRR
jgi:type VI secretion system protein ImpJ